MRRLAGEPGRTPGRSYQAADLPLLASMGLAAGYMALVILALYIQSDSVRLLYRHPGRLWLATPLLAYWTSRMWLLSHRGEMDDDPVAFAVAATVTWAVAAAGLAIGAAATL